ncbi:MAG: hypothetical protein ACR2NZ_25805 [Rubripirellula sp.]
MTRRILLFIALLLVGMTQSHANGPLSRLLGTRRYSQPVQNVTPPYRGVALSPEQMTKVYGPSILVRDVAQRREATKPAKNSRFVTQP